MRTVAIIGGGVTGLICIKCCLDGGLSPVCYEMTNDIGGLWNYDASSVDGKASVMKSTVINTSKEFMAFSDYPPSSHYPNYMHNTKLLEYFREYTRKFDLTKYIRFQKRVVRIQPADDYEQTGCWLIYSINAENKVKTNTNDDNQRCEKYDAVMLATGHHAIPKWIDFPGLENFKGRKLHSWQYKTSHGFEDKNVLVIGIGNSGGDIVIELSRAAKQVYLSTRRGTWVLNRIGPNGWPADLLLSNTVYTIGQKYFPSLSNWLIERELNKRFDHEIYGIKPAHRPLEQHPCVNDDLANRILNGTVIIKPNIKEFNADGHGVVFTDDSKVDPIDCVIMATGFNIAFPYLDDNILSVKENRIRLYKYVWPAHMTHSTLAVMGLIQPWGAINPITELQARWAVRVFNGELKLPSRVEMDQDIDEKIYQMSVRYVESSRHTVQVDHVDFCNELADQVGCRPNIWNYLLKDFQLGWLLLFGPCTPYRYRLQGPNKWNGARQAIFTQYERVEYPLLSNIRKTGKSQRNKFSIQWTPVLAMTLFLLILIINFQNIF